MLQRPPPPTRPARPHADAERHPGRAARAVVVALDQPRRALDAALAAVAAPCDAGGLARAPHGLLARPPLWPRLGATGRPAAPGAARGAGGFVAGEAREGGAGWREAPRGTARRPAAPAHVWGGPLPLRCPGPAAPPRHALVLAHEVQRRPARRGGGALTPYALS